MIYAVALSSPDSVKLLLNAGGDVDVGVVDGITPLMLAAALNSRTMVNMLLAAGASVDDQAVEIPYLHLPGIRNYAVAELRRNLPPKPVEGASALWLASYVGNAEIVELLLKAGAADNTEASFEDGPDLKKDPVSCTAEGAAELRGHKLVIKAFDKAYADRQAPPAGNAAKTGLLQDR